MSEIEIKEIAKNLFLIRTPEATFHRNIYIKKFVGADGSQVNMIFDPGTKLDIGLLTKALRDLIGGIQNIHIIFINHQDPDVTSNVSAFLNTAPQSVLISSEDTWRLVKMYGLSESRFKAVESFNASTITIKKTGHKIQFVSSIYCHFRGAVMVYDIETRTLLSGDFLGGVNTRKTPGVYADHTSWEGISLFHEIYMPSTEAIKQTIERISFLSPRPEIIAPQHGDVIKKEAFPFILPKMRGLKVGIDLLMEQTVNSELLKTALQDFFDEFQMGSPEIHSLLLQKLSMSEDFTAPFIFQNTQLMEIKISSNNAISLLFTLLQDLCPERIYEIKMHLVDSLEKYGIIIPGFLQDTQDIGGPMLKEIAESRPAVDKQLFE